MNDRKSIIGAHYSILLIMDHLVNDVIEEVAIKAISLNSCKVCDPQIIDSMTGLNKKSAYKRKIGFGPYWYSFCHTIIANKRISLNKYKNSLIVGPLRNIIRSRKNRVAIHNIRVNKLT